MIVSGRNRKRYVLSNAPVSSSLEGSVYSVEGNRDTLVMVYGPSHRKSAEENKVLSAVNRRADLAGRIPIDAVYLQGSFVGYAFERSARSNTQGDHGRPRPAPAPRNSRSLSPLTLLIGLLIGVALSVLIHFALMRGLSGSVDSTVLFFNFNGIPMMITGFLCMGLVCFSCGDKLSAAVLLILATLAYLAGATVTFFLIWLLVSVVQTSVALLTAILPTLIVIVIVIYVFKKLIGH